MFGFSTGMPLIDAEDDFRRARRRRLLGRLLSLLRGRRVGEPRVLSEAEALPNGRVELQVIPVGSIVGTVDPAPHFDDSFRPASERLRRRWERIALAHRTGVPLPPIEVRRGRDGYYVIDGRHRVSVARAIGHPDIDAWVTGFAAPRGLTGA